jgi:hypothetical protein
VRRALHRIQRLTSSAIAHTVVKEGQGRSEKTLPSIDQLTARTEWTHIEEQDSTRRGIDLGLALLQSAQERRLLAKVGSKWLILH